MKRMIQLTVACVVVMVSTAGQVRAEMVVLSSIADAEITGDSPFTGFDQWANRSDSPSSETLFAERSSDGTEVLVVRDILIEFDLSGIADGANISSATFAFSMGLTSEPVDGVYVIADVFEGIGLDRFPEPYYYLNSNTQPQGALQGPLRNPVGAGARIELDFTSIVQSFVDIGATYLTVQFSADSGESYNIVRDFPSGGYLPEQFPALAVDFTPAAAPEPSTYAGLLGITCVSLLAYGIRRKRQQAA